MNKVYISDDQVRKLLLEIIRQMVLDNFRPDVVVGLVRGGTTPANYVSQFFDIPCIMINKDDVPSVPMVYKNVLVIDDINDTGSALTEFNDAMFEDSDLHVFKYATLVTNEASCFTVDYTGKYINKVEAPCWVVYPWEVWWINET